MTKATKSIFEKTYILKAQAEKAIEKEFGADASKYQAVVKEGVVPTRYVVEVVEVEEVVEHMTLAEALAESGETLEDLKNDEFLLAQADRVANAQMAFIDNNPAKPRFSSVQKPTKKVWDIADSMPMRSRKEVIERCVELGIAYGTARTQYQAWFKASQECMRDDIRKPGEKGSKGE